MSRCFYLNGEFVPEEKAVMPVTQTGIQRAYGIFDLFRAQDSKPRFFQDYLNRFEKSQKFLNLTRLIEREEIEVIVSELQSRNQFKHSTFKIVLVGDGTDTLDTLFQPFFYIINTPFDLEVFPTEMGVITEEFLRDSPEIKSLVYLNSYALHRKRIAAKAGEVLYHFNGQVSEASRSNVFVIKDGRLITPSTNILHGITRLHVLKVAKEILPVEVGVLSLEDLLSADEIFLTSTIKEVLPVCFVDEKQWNVPGPYTVKIQKAFQEYLREQSQV